MEKDATLAAETTADSLPSGAAASGQFEMILDDFCRELSSKKKSPELIGGFHHTCLVAGTTRATAAAFGDAFALFVNQPA